MKNPSDETIILLSLPKHRVPFWIKKYSLAFSMNGSKLFKCSKTVRWDRVCPGWLKWWPLGLSTIWLLTYCLCSPSRIRNGLAVRPIYSQRGKSLQLFFLALPEINAISCFTIYWIFDEVSVSCHLASHLGGGRKCKRAASCATLSTLFPPRCIFVAPSWKSFWSVSGVELWSAD